MGALEVAAQLRAIPQRLLLVLLNEVSRPKMPAHGSVLGHRDRCRVCQSILKLLSGAVHGPANEPILRVSEDIRARETGIAYCRRCCSTDEGFMVKGRGRCGNKDSGVLGRVCLGRLPRCSALSPRGTLIRCLTNTNARVHFWAEEVSTNQSATQRFVTCRSGTTLFTCDWRADTTRKKPFQLHDPGLW